MTGLPSNALGVLNRQRYEESGTRPRGLVEDDSARRSSHARGANLSSGRRNDEAFSYNGDFSPRSSLKM